MQPGFPFLFENGLEPWSGGPGGLLGSRPQPDGSAVGVELFDVDDAQVRGRQRAHRGQDRVVLEVLVVDGVELGRADQIQRVVHLDAEPSVVGDEDAQRTRELDQVGGDVGVDVVRDDQIGRAVLAADVLGGAFVEECGERGHPPIPRAAAPRR